MTSLFASPAADASNDNPLPAPCPRQRRQDRAADQQRAGMATTDIPRGELSVTTKAKPYAPELDK
jgi:hypothetical protein